MHASTQRGRWVATALAGAWRQTPPPWSLTPAQLAEIAPLLLRGGASALVWRRVRDLEGRDEAAALRLRDGSRLHRLQAALHDRELSQAWALLASRTRPLLAKGWAAARLYPEQGLRPYGDLDIAVAPADYAAARDLLAQAPDYGVDLHRGFALLDDRPLETVHERALGVEHRDLLVRALGPEDHLRYLALHALGHGGWRPLWFCDLGAALETRSAGFDWDYFFSGNERRSEWVSCALLAAHRLLGADLTGVPRCVTERRLPSWFEAALLREWGRPFVAQGNRTPMAYYRRDPLGALGALFLRWPNPIEATVGVRGPLNEWPRLPFQLLDSARRTARFVSSSFISGGHFAQR